ncbi:MAG: hypothetical protein ACR2M0_16775 [Chloroflexia bacterium]
MNRRARRRAKRGQAGAGGLFSTGPRWAALGRGLRRRTRASRPTRGRGNELLLTALYALLGALCLALAALLFASSVAAPLSTSGHPPALRGELIWAAALGALGVLLLGAALRRLRR